MKKFFHPSSWPIAGKLAMAFVFAALIPIFLTAIYGMRESIARVTENEERNITDLAEVTAQKIERTLQSARRTLKLTQRGEIASVVQTLNREPQLAKPYQFQIARKPTVREKSVLDDVVAENDYLSTLRASSEEIELLLVLDVSGRVALATSPFYIGRDLSWREYFKAGIGGREYTSSLEIGSRSNRAGIFMSRPLRDADGDIVGVSVVKIVGEAIDITLDSAKSRLSITPFLLDEYGVFATHSNDSLRYKSLLPLADVQKQNIISQRRYGGYEDGVYTPPPLASADMPALAGLVSNLIVPTHGRYLSPASGEVEVVGLARVYGANLIVGVSEPVSRWEAPLRALFLAVFLKVLIVALIAGFVAYILFSRDIIRPVKQLTRAAASVKDGKLNVRARELNDDEIGDLARTFNSMIGEIVERERERDVFGRVVTPEVREKLLAGQIKLGGENRHVTILFSDIRDFTTICEGLAPEKVVELLNEFLTEMTAAVKAHGGHVNNFLGDAIIVIFGAPDDHADPAWAAVQAAFEMRQRLVTLNANRESRGEVAIKAGIGIGTGIVVAGQMGSLERFIYTVVGDAVNVAARLETLTKEFADNPILVNAKTAELLSGRDGVNVVVLGKHAIKGKRDEIEVYQVEIGKV
jgi:adenylate cyclase